MITSALRDLARVEVGGMFDRAERAYLA